MNEPPTPGRAPSFHVVRERLLATAEVFTQERDDIMRTLGKAQLGQVPLCAGDPVSIWASRAFQEKIDPIVTHATSFAAALLAAADECQRQARRYGATDEEIKAGFR